MALLRDYRWLFVLVAATLFYFYPGGDPNQTSRWLLTEAIVLRHAPDITPDHARTVDKGELHGRYYSDKAIGTSLLAVPIYGALRVAERVTKLDSSDRVVARARLHAVAFLLAGVPTAITAALLARALRRLGTKPVRAALLGCAFALGTIAFPYATVLYGHALAGCLLFGCFLVVLEWDADGDKSELGSRRAILLGLLGASAFVVEYPTALPVAIVLGYALVRSPRAALVRTVRAMALGAAPFILLHVAFSTWAFDSPLSLPYKYVVEPLFRSHTSSGLFGVGLPIPTAVYGAFFSAYRGLFFFCPITILAFAGYGAWVAQERHLRIAALSAAVTAAGFAFVASYYAWHGGLGVGSRHLVPFCAFLVLPIGYLVERSAAWRGVTAAFGTLGVLVMSAVMFVTMHFPEEDPFVGSPFYSIVIPALLRGETSLAFADVFSTSGRLDVAFNLGTLFGASSVASIALPVCAWAAALGVVWASCRRDASRTRSA